MTVLSPILHILSGRMLSSRSRSLVRPQVEYASVVWSPYTKDNINKIEKVQRRAARWVTNDYSSYSSVTDMLSNLGWRSLENRRTDTRQAMFYKIVYGLVAIPLPSYFEHLEVYTRHMHSLFNTDRFTHQSVIINTHFPHIHCSLEQATS